MPDVPPTPVHVLSEEQLDGLRKINSTAVIDTLARNGYEPHHVYMPNIKNMNPGERLVGRAVTVRFVPARPDADDQADGPEPGAGR